MNQIPTIDTCASDHRKSVTILFVVNTIEFFLSHRLPLAIAAKNAGFTVHITTGSNSVCNQVTELGFTHHLLPLSRSGRNPVSELYCLWSLYQLMRKIRPNLVHLVTIKPVLYGGLMARLSNVPGVIAAISGLGTMFIDHKNSRWIRRTIESLYRLALNHNNIKVIFQNPDDRSVLIGIGAIRDGQTALIKGSGISLTAYPIHTEPEGIPVVTLAARLLKDKGVREFIEAARILRKRNISARFWLIGSPDLGNPTSITNEDILLWKQEGLVELWGYRSDIAELFAKSNIVVLPSYREGLPKVLIEAAACGRAIITTDVPGCRDAIKPGETGLLIPVRDTIALADAIQSLIQNPIYRKSMGIAGRNLATHEFTIEKVVSAHMKIYQELLAVC